jgi:hypothetical protein
MKFRETRGGASKVNWTRKARCNWSAENFATVYQSAVIEMAD